MGDARTEVLAAMSRYAQADSAGDLYCDHAGLLDAIPTAALAALLVERGGLVPSVWEEPADQTPMGVSEPEYYPYDPDDEDAIDAADQLGHVLLYRLSEEPT